MSSPQVDRLQALLSRVQGNRIKPRAAANGAGAAAAKAHAPQPSHAMEEALDAAPGFFAPAAQDSIDTTPPPAAIPKPPQPQPQVMREPARPEPVRQEPFRQEPIREPFRQEPIRQEPMRSRPAIEAEHVRVPDLKPSAPARLPPQPDRPMPTAARPTAPGATPLEMALEGEVARAAESAAMMSSPPVADLRADIEPGGRVLADPTPPQVSRPIVQAVTKHPPAQPHTFAELLKRSLALRPR